MVMPRLKKAPGIILLAVLVVVFFCGEVNAASEKDILDFIRAPFVINGKTEYVHENFILRAERFFNTHKYTPAEYEQILARLKEVLAIMQQEGQVDPTSMTWQSEHRVLSLIYECAEIARIRVDYEKNYLRFYELDGTLIDEIHYTENAFKITGLRDSAALGVGLVLTALGLGLWSCRRRIMA